jgi:hypothetical protein
MRRDRSHVIAHFVKLRIEVDQALRTSSRRRSVKARGGSIASLLVNLRSSGKHLSGREIGVDLYPPRPRPYR